MSWPQKDVKLNTLFCGEKILPSKRLLILLRFAKSRHNAPISWRLVADSLADEYSPNMPLSSVIFHLSEAFAEIKAEPRFQLGTQGSLTELLLAPVNGFSSVELFGSPGLDTRYSVEQFYDSFVRHIIGLLAVTNIGWCREELWCDSQSLTGSDTKVLDAYR